MNRTPITPDLSQFPQEFHPLLHNTPVYDSSCSAAARVWFLDRDGGLFLKSAPAGSLKKEAAMTRFFHGKGLSAQVLSHITARQDWLLTRRIPGEDCVSREYLDDPVRLCDTLAHLLRSLHEQDPAGCPVTDLCSHYRTTARIGLETGSYSPDLFPSGWGFSSQEEAWQEAETNGRYLQNDALLHGDYCLPNIILDHWKFSGFIDLDSAGIGDRHIDLFWAVWTLNYNLKTNRYFHRFLDAYGPDAITPEKLRTVAALETFR